MQGGSLFERRGYDPQLLLDYRIEYTKEDPDGWIMYIFDCETKAVVATL